MCRFTVLMLTLAMSATAADFRALNIGESCASAREWEIAKGSTPTQLTDGSSNSYWLGFRGKALGRDVYLSYLCRDGVLFTGNYSFPVESLNREQSPRLLIWGVVIDGQLAHVGTFGVQNLTTKVPVSDTTAFRIASMTKSFTVLAILKLRDQGELSLEDPVSKWIPEFAKIELRTPKGIDL